MDYHVAQAFCSHIIPRVVLLFAGEAPDNCKDFEPDDGEGYDDRDNEGGEEGGSLTYRDVNKNQRYKSRSRSKQIHTVNKRERTNSFFYFFRRA